MVDEQVDVRLGVTMAARSILPRMRYIVIRDA
jgi:hypothetical protein